MFSQSYSFVGYFPALTAEQIGKAKDEMAIVDGQNFAWKLNGVFSAYAHESVGKPTEAVIMRHPYDAVIAGQLYVFFSNGVWRLENGLFTQVFDFAGAPAFENPKGWDLSLYKWTSAYIGTRHWFCHPAVGLVYYDQFDDEWGFFRDDCWSGPVYACCNADNRLVVLLEDVVAWSRFDRGNEFTCDTWHCGAGAQSLALIKYGQPYSVMPYSKGWLTFTSMGTMVSRPVQDLVGAPDGRSVAPGALVFNHSLVSAEAVCIGTTAMTHVDDSSVIWLTQNGFRSFSPSQGGGWGGLNNWQPEMSQFYAETLLPALQSDFELDTVNIEVSRDCGWVFISSRPQDYALLGYSRAHVFQPDIGKWGSFNWPHTQIGRHRDGGISSDLGYLDNAGRLQKVDHALSSGIESWIKFSPVRLQVPNDPNGVAELITATQTFRFGTSKPGWPTAPALTLESSWKPQVADSAKRAEPPTHCRFFVSSGFSAEEPNVDMQQWLTEVSQHSSVVYLSGTSTGILHTIGAVATSDMSEYFCINSVEVSYTFAGVK